jgi:hypothetical protein
VEEIKIEIKDTCLFELFDDEIKLFRYMLLVLTGCLDEQFYVFYFQVEDAI